MSSEDTDEMVEALEMDNHLKQKIGEEDREEEGSIDPTMVDEADILIEKMCRDCPALVKAILFKIVAKWDELRSAESEDDKSEKAQEMFTLAHEIKDISSLCGYVLISDLAESLRDYIVETRLGIEEQTIIVQAHIDAIRAAQHENIRDEGGPLAQALKAAVKKAIDKYS